MQMQQQLEAQQAQHAAQISDMEGKANEMQSMWRQVSDLDQQHLAQLRAREADLDELNQVRQLQPNSKCVWCLQLGSTEMTINSCSARVSHADCADGGSPNQLSMFQNS